MHCCVLPCTSHLYQSRNTQCLLYIIIHLKYYLLNHQSITIIYNIYAAIELWFECMEPLTEWPAECSFLDLQCSQKSVYVWPLAEGGGKRSIFNWVTIKPDFLKSNTVCFFFSFSKEYVSFWVIQSQDRLSFFTFFFKGTKYIFQFSKRNGVSFSSKERGIVLS